MSKPASSMTKTSRPPKCGIPLTVLIGGYVLLFFYLAYHRWAVFGNDTTDFGHFNNMFWWTIRGRLFYVSQSGGSNLGVHAALLWAELIPIYWLFPGVPILIFMQTLSLGICAWPMYLIAREIFQDHKTALIAAGTFIFFPPIVSQNVNQIEEPSFVAVYLLFTFYYFMKGRFGLFLLFACISCLDRENMPLAVAMFGLYAAIQRRTWKWIVVPPAVGIPYFLLAMKVIIPHYQLGEQWFPMRMFSYLGSTPGAAALTMVMHPGFVLQHLTGAENVMYFVYLVQPLAWLLPFGGAASLMALPDLGINLLANNSAMKVVGWHYNVVTGCFLFIGALFTVKKLAQWMARHGNGKAVAPVMVAGLAVLSMTHWFLWFYPSQYFRLPYHDTLLRAMEVVPADKSVLVPSRLRGHVSSRAHSDSIEWFQNKPEFAAQFEYVILDANERQYPPIITQKVFDSFQKNPAYRLVFAENNVFVFHRLGGESDWKVSPG
jgi:uncharacterized membrane protein